jgi:hypothetical protein
MKPREIAGLSFFPTVMRKKSLSSSFSLGIPLNIKSPHLNTKRTKEWVHPRPKASSLPLAFPEAPN